MARGGYRPGAGRPKGSKSSNTQADVPNEANAENLDPLTYMLKVMNDSSANKGRRDRMAVAAAPFVHARAGEAKGKKEQKEERAKKAGTGKFAPSRPPLKLVGRDGDELKK